MQQISFFEEGEPLIDGEPGDLKFVVRTQPHSSFARRGVDLLYNATITLEDALVGFSREVGAHFIHIISTWQWKYASYQRCRTYSPTHPLSQGVVQCIRSSCAKHYSTSLAVIVGIQLILPGMPRQHEGFQRGPWT